MLYKASLVDVCWFNSWNCLLDTLTFGLEIGIYIIKTVEILLDAICNDSIMKIKGNIKSQRFGLINVVT